MSRTSTACQPTGNPSDSYPARWLLRRQIKALELLLAGPGFTAEMLDDGMRAPNRGYPGAVFQSPALREVMYEARPVKSSVTGNWVGFWTLKPGAGEKAHATLEALMLDLAVLEVEALGERGKAVLDNVAQRLDVLEETLGMRATDGA